MGTCQALSTLTGITDWLVWPTSCNYHIYLYILEFLFLFLSWSSFQASEKKGRDDLLSSLGISSIVVLVLGAIGTFIKNSSSVAMIQSDIILVLLAQFIVCVALWRMKG